MLNFSWLRLWAIMVKEFIFIKRDKGTLLMVIGLPILQIILFGYAINNDPKHLPTAVLAADHSTFTQAFISSMENSGYYKITNNVTSEAEANKLLATNKVLFVLSIPTNFTRDLIRGYRPSLLLEADATDPSSTSNAIAAANILAQTAFNYKLQGALGYVNNYGNGYNNPIITQKQVVVFNQAPIDLRIHPRYNPAGLTQLNIVPGLVGVILTMTMVMITAAAITREREIGTMENLLATPVQPLEVMIGKVLPYIIVGYLQMIIVLLTGVMLFSVPIQGSLVLLFIIAFPFIAANLSVGLLMSTLAANQLQAIQMTTFFFLPSILLSGFMFPFAGMPAWAQYIGEVLPLTHFLRIVRGILLKGNGLFEVWPDVWPIFVFLVGIILLGVKRFHKTLD